MIREKATPRRSGVPAGQRFVSPLSLPRPPRRTSTPAQEEEEEDPREEDP